MQTAQSLHEFHANPAAFEHSEPFWRVLKLTTLLQLHFGVHYEPRLKDARPSNPEWDWRDSRDILLNGPLGPKRSGSCPSLPVLLVAIGLRLGYPLRLVHAPAHVFARWDAPRDPNPRRRGRFNIEYHGHGMNSEPDAHYHTWPIRWPDAWHAQEAARPKPLYLRSLEPAEVFASFLVHRCHILEAHDRHEEAHDIAHRAAELAPDDVLAVDAAKSAHRGMLKRSLDDWGLSEAGFFERLRLRRAGMPTPPFPWESAGLDLRHTASPLTGRGPAGPPDPMQDPIAAATFAFMLQLPNRGSPPPPPGSPR